MNDPRALSEAIDGVGHVVHCAGVNRGSDDDVYQGNVDLAQQLAAALLVAPMPPYSLTFANSVHSQSTTAYGRGKARASAILAAACAATGIDFRDVQLPGLFGEHGRPDYNSVVATFCYAIASGRPLELRADKELSLLGVRDAATQLLGGLSEVGPMPATTTIDVSALRELLVEFDANYRTGEIPRLDTRFRTQLFNTYRSFTFPDRFPIALSPITDSRGSLVETVRVHGGAGQSFVSTTRPGATRGQHFHLDKVERFVVVAGSATIALRRVLFDQVITFRVSGDQPVIVDMPTLWTHNLTNVGTTTLITQFWTNQIFDAAAPDTYYETV